MKPRDWPEVLEEQYKVVGPGNGQPTNRSPGLLVPDAVLFALYEIRKELSRFLRQLETAAVRMRATIKIRFLVKTGALNSVTYGGYSASRASGLDAVEVCATDSRPVGLHPTISVLRRPISPLLPSSGPQVNWEMLL